MCIWLLFVLMIFVYLHYMQLIIIIFVLLLGDKALMYYNGMSYVNLDVNVISCTEDVNDIMV